MLTAGAAPRAEKSHNPAPRPPAQRSSRKGETQGVKPMAVQSKLTLSVMTADVGGFIGHVSSHPELLDTARERLFEAREKGVIIDYHVLRCGDDLGLVITHSGGTSSSAIHELALNIYTACEKASTQLKLHAPERGLSKEAFTGSLTGMGPGVAEVEFTERAGGPIVIL